jgi:hypothetical protein
LLLLLLPLLLLLLLLGGWILCLVGAPFKRVSCCQSVGHGLHWCRLRRSAGRGKGRQASGFRPRGGRFPWAAIHADAGHGRPHQCWGRRFGGQGCLDLSDWYSCYQMLE